MPTRETPFKFGTVVDGDFFTDRTEEVPKVQQMLSGANHLVIISPRRYGKTSLVSKAIPKMNRPFIFINLQMTTSTTALAEALLKAFFEIHPWERFKEALRQFRVRPTLSFSPESNNINITFGRDAPGHAALEDVLNFLDEKSDPARRLIVVLDEFQEIANLEPGTDKLLRGIMQLQKNINYLFLGSEESMMRAIFEDIKSPFFHFGALMQLGRIPKEDFTTFLVEKLESIRGDKALSDAKEILKITKCHPCYTQQLAASFWDLLQDQDQNATVLAAAENVLLGLSAAYQTIWARFVGVSRDILITLAHGEKLQELRQYPSSTIYSAIARLKKEGIVVKNDGFELEDPFFALWIQRKFAIAAFGTNGKTKLPPEA